MTRTAPAPFPMAPRAGFTLVETLILLVIVGVVTAIGMPRLRESLIRNEVRSARTALVALHARARAAAVARGQTTTITFNGNRVVITAPRVSNPALLDTVRLENLDNRYGVAITLNPTAQTTYAFDPRGVGSGTPVEVKLSRLGLRDSVTFAAFGRVVVP